MTLSLSDIPPCPADPEELRRLAASLETASSATRLATDHVLFTWGLLPGVYHAPEASELQQSLRQLGPASAEIDAGLRNARAAIETLADDLEAADRRRDALIARLREHEATASLAFPEASDPLGRRLADVERGDRELAFRREYAALVEDWDAAARACAAALRAIPDVSWTLARDLPAEETVLANPSTSVLDEAALPLLHRLARRDGADAARLLRQNPQWADIIRRGQPDAVATWWASLSPTTAAALVAGVPALIGNLDGVALADRVAANRARAAGHLADLRAKRDRALGLHGPAGAPRARVVPSANVNRIDREIAYFQAVAAGRKLLYAWDPSHGSLIEMSGDPSTAKAALFVVPGTNTTADSFYVEEPITRFANWQVRGGRESVVAFTVMTGPMPQLDEILSGGGPQWNHYAEDRAPEYAQFVKGVQAADPSLWTMSYEHSYGGGVGSAAEAYGGTVNARFLAASVGAADDYTPSADTAYFSAQGPDDINRYYAGLQLGPFGFGTRPESISDVNIVASGLPGVDPLNVALGAPFVIAASVDHHNRLMSDDEEVNGTVLNTVNQILNESRAEE
ncbi:PspA/IM30 family protein [Microbacterium enclense]|uniref:Alpha/beta hydrolase n=1 Tax=Microbacterium enclense TaxID=993073 RepID=A0A1G6HBV9_9MICO|nr:hypothetical protein [Microbacterium enclense]KSU55193.1 hypothetical protein AS029_03915 [Microbacterium enclense]SDB91759.1 hypothetical protein SAMN05216418_1029 [Microbacterium enclense]